MNTAFFLNMYDLLIANPLPYNFAPSLSREQTGFAEVDGKDRHEALYNYNNHIGRCHRATGNPRAVLCHHNRRYHEQ